MTIANHPATIIQPHRPVAKPFKALDQIKP
jgi:hypothetical protein